jgi:hypothetical protein
MAISISAIFNQLPCFGVSGLDLEPILAAYDNYIRSETLAKTLIVGPITGDDYTVKVELNSGEVTIGVYRS